MPMPKFLFKTEDDEEGITVGELLIILQKLPKQTKIFANKDTSDFWDEVRAVEYVEGEALHFLNKWP